MNSKLYNLTDAQLDGAKVTDAQPDGACINPAMGERLSAYLADPLESPAAQEVEAHLLDCRHCREFFLTVLSFRGEARMAQKTKDGEEQCAEQHPKVLKMAHYRKG